MEETQVKSKFERLGLGKNIKTAVLVVGLIAIPIVIGAFGQAQNLRNQDNSAVLAATEANNIIEKVGRLMELPNEEPTVATVSDVESLRDQQFFQKAQNGDNVIIFPKAQKAILYRPSTNKIVEIALYTPPSPTATPVENSVPSSPQSIQDLIGGDETSVTPIPSGSPAPTAETSPTTTPVPTISL